MLLPLLLAAAPAAASALPPASWPADIDLSAGTDLDEAYRAEFAQCDAADRFRDRHAHCRGDPNNVTQLRRLPGGAVAFTSKLAVDLDGSAFACSDAREASDQCPTSLMLPDGQGDEVPVDSDTVPYVVIPSAAPDDAASGSGSEFARLTGLHPGDYGVVVYRGRVVPVIVADTGPFAKLGEGSLALHRALGHDWCARRDAGGTCTAMRQPIESIGGDVTTVLFPGSATAGLTPATIAATVRQEGMRRWRASAVARTTHALPAG